MKSRHLGASIVAILGLSLALNALAHGDAKGHDDGAQQGHVDEHAGTLGKPGDPAKVSRTINVTMSDAMRFQPDKLTVKRGETIRFKVNNTGKVKHEMVLGTIKELKEHAALMRKFPEMEHADPNQISVGPGETGELIWQFTRAGTFDFACLVPGHFEAGMKGKVAVKR